MVTKNEQCTTLSRGCLDVYWCLKIPRQNFTDSTGQASWDSNPMEDVMHHITFAILVSLCEYAFVCVVKQQEKGGGDDYLSCFGP